jgi:hypothetical protein
MACARQAPDPDVDEELGHRRTQARRPRRPAGSPLQVFPGAPATATSAVRLELKSRPPSEGSHVPARCNLRPPGARADDGSLQAALRARPRRSRPGPVPFRPPGPGDRSADAHSRHRRTTGRQADPGRSHPRPRAPPPDADEENRLATDAVHRRGGKVMDHPPPSQTHVIASSTPPVRRGAPRRKGGAALPLSGAPPEHPT